MSTFSTSLGAKIGILIVFVILVAFIIYLLVRSTPRGPRKHQIIPWQPLYPTNVGPFAADGVTQVFRPYVADGLTCTSDMCAQYFGVIDVKPGQLIGLSMPNESLVYWEFQVRKYPSWDLVHAIPMEHFTLFNGRRLPLKPGLYSFTLRTAGQVPNSLLGISLGDERVDLSKIGGLQYVEKDGDVMSWHIATYNDEDRYTQATNLLQQIVPQMEQQGYQALVRESLKSQEIAAPSPYIHREQLTLTLKPNQALILIHSGRDAMSTLIIATDDQVSYPECKVGPIHYHLVTTPGKTVIDEYIFGVDPRSAFLPIYAYIFDRF